MKNINTIRKEIENTTARSAWSRGVKLYAIELLENLQQSGDSYDFNSLLNGAESWTKFSYGGCSLICDRDIAERLCTPSEFKRADGGRLNPNSRESWLDCQARALYQAARLVKSCAIG